MKVVKAAWKNLRTVFGREIPKCINATSGDSGDEEDGFYTGEWPFFNNLRFLTDTMSGRKMSGPLQSAELIAKTPTPEPAPAASNVHSSTSIDENETIASNTNPSSLGLHDSVNETDYMEEVLIDEEEEDFSMFDCPTKRSSSAGTFFVQK